MKKKLLAILLVAALVLSTFGLVACRNEPAAPADTPAGTTADGDDPAPVDPGDRQVINVWSFTDEIPNAMERFTELNPDFPFVINATVIATDGGGYQTALDQALLAGGSAAPDIFTAESAFVLKYTQGEAAQFALPYSELGIDVENLINAADIATYIVDLGRNLDGEVVGLAFQNTGSGLIYRRDIALEVWGTDDPEEVGAIVGPGWDRYIAAAADLYAAGFAIASGEGDLWQAIRNGAVQPYIIDGYLELCDNRAMFFDVARALREGDYTNRASSWSDEWFADMSGNGPREVFGFLGPAWLINYVMAGNSGDTFGNWGLTHSPVPFSWGGTWVIPNAQGNPDVRDGVATLLEWITLDTSATGFQAKFAAGSLFEGSERFSAEAAAFADGMYTKDAVASGVVMAGANGELPFLAGQDMFDIFIPAGLTASGVAFGPFDEIINSHFEDQVLLYVEGLKTREEAIADWKQNIQDLLDIPHR